VVMDSGLSPCGLPRNDGVGKSVIAENAERPTRQSSRHASAWNRTSHLIVRHEPSMAQFIGQRVARNSFRGSDMRTKRLVPGLVPFLALVIGSGLAAQHPVLAQDYRGTQEQQMACTPDVWRLCAAQIPDVDRIVACLRANTPSLSDACRAVFAGSPPERGRRAPPPRGRPAPPPYYDDDD
jgi:hypothetical protein